MFRVILVFASAFLLADGPASYDLVCPNTCTAFDGSTQPAGTVLNRVLWNGQTTYQPVDGAGVALNLVLTGNPPAPIYTTPPAAPTSIAPLDFINRLTPAEQTNITTAAQSNAQIMLFLLKLSGALQVNVNDPLTIAGMQAMENAGLIAPGRAAQILNLSVTSP